MSTAADAAVEAEAITPMVPVFLNGKIPGVNVDALNVGAGVNYAISLGFDGNLLTVIEYGLARWARGEEAAAERMVVQDYRIDYTTWRMVLATAMASVRGEPSNEQ